MTGILDRRGEGWARELFQKRFYVYAPFRDGGVDLVLTQCHFGTGRQVEIQVKYTEQVYWYEERGHFAFGITRKGLRKYSINGHTYFLFLARPLVFSGVPAKYRISAKKRMRDEAKYLVSVSEVMSRMSKAEPEDRLGIDEDGHPMLGTRRLSDVSWTKYNFNTVVKEIEQQL